jgi:hypothetical protein
VTAAHSCRVSMTADAWTVRLGATCGPACVADLEHDRAHVAPLVAEMRQALADARAAKRWGDACALASQLAAFGVAETATGGEP